MDIINNEELENKAKELGFSKLLVLGVNANIIEEKDFSKIPKLKNKYVNFIAKGTRKAFENKNIQFILPIMNHPKDHTHYRNSGMDQILAKISKQKNKTIIFDFSELQNSKNRQQLLGRWMQNIRLCKKYKVDWEIVSFAKNSADLKSANDLKAIKRLLT